MSLISCVGFSAGPFDVDYASYVKKRFAIIDKPEPETIVIIFISNTKIFQRELKCGEMRGEIYQDL